MRMRYVLLAVVAIGCGGGGGDGGPTGTGNGNGTGTGTGTGTGGGTGTGTASGTASVAMKETDDGYGYAVYSFAPASGTVTKGGTVTWTNEAGKTAHNVTFSTAGAPSGVSNFTTGTSSRTFSNTGSFSYQCTNHPGMSGTVTVQ